MHSPSQERFTKMILLRSVLQQKIICMIFPTTILLQYELIAYNYSSMDKIQMIFSSFELKWAIHLNDYFLFMIIWMVFNIVKKSTTYHKQSPNRYSYIRITDGKKKFIIFDWIFLGIYLRKHSVFKSLFNAFEFRGDLYAFKDIKSVYFIRIITYFVLFYIWHPSY